MKTLKKSLVLVLALMMSLGVLASASGAAFKDADKITPEYKDAINYLEAVGAVAGTDNGELLPQSTIKRCEFAKILYVAATGNDYKKADTYAGLNTFSDVPSTEWYAGVVNYAAYKGWLLGVGEGKFAPDDPIKTVDAITVVLRILGYGKYDELSDGKTYAANAIDVADMLGLLVNTDKNKVDYYGTATREVCFELLYQAMQQKLFQKGEDTDTYEALNGNIDGYKQSEKTLGDKFDVDIEYDLYLLESTKDTCTINTYTDKDGKETYAVYGTPIINGVPNFEKSTCIIGIDPSVDEIGHIIRVAYNENGGEKFGAREAVNAISYEVVSKVMDVAAVKEDDLEKPKIDFVDYEVLVAVNTAAKELNYAVIEEDLFVVDEDNTVETTLVEDVDGIPAGKYYTITAEALFGDDVDEELKGMTIIYGVPYAMSFFGLGEVDAVENEDGEMEFAGETAEELAAKGEFGYEKITKEGTYLVRYDEIGCCFYNISVLEAGITDGKVESVKTSGGDIVSIKVGGKTYNVFAGTDSLTWLDEFDATEVAIGEELDFYFVDGKIVAATATAFGPTEDEEEPVEVKFDGFAEVTAFQYKVVGEKTDASILGAATYKNSLAYAKVKVLLSNGTEAVYDVPTFEKTTGTGDKAVTGIYMANPDGKSEDIALIADIAGDISGTYTGLYATGSVVTDNTTIFPTTVDVYGYAIDGKEINLYELSALGVDKKVIYAVDKTYADATIEKSQPSFDGRFITKAPFLALNAKGEYITFTGSANIPGLSVDAKYVVIKTVTTDGKAVTTVEFIKAGEVETDEETEKLETYVYIDVAEVETTADGLIYTGYKADGTPVELTFANEATGDETTELEESGLYIYYDDMTVTNECAFAGPAAIDTFVELDESGAYILVDDQYYALTGADICEFVKIDSDFAYAIGFVKDYNVTELWIIEGMVY